MSNPALILFFTTWISNCEAIQQHHCFESLPSWGESLIDKATAIAIDNALHNDGSVLRIRVPVCVNPVGQDSKWSSFDMYIRKEESDNRRKPLFVREGITIPEDRVGKIRGYTCMAMIEVGPLATLLGDSENPAHTEWEKKAVKFKGRYKWGPTTIDFVRLAFRKLLGLLAQADEEEDKDVLADIFFIDIPEDDEDVPKSRKQRVVPKDDDEPFPPPPPPIPQRKQYYKLVKTSGGFSLTGTDLELPTARSIRLRVAYDVEGATKSTALNNYHKNDFDLNNNITNMENISDGSIDQQTVTFIASDNNFRLEAGGFDTRRDLIIDVQTRAVKDETH